MSQVIGRLLVILAFGWTASVSALPIVTVDGKDWLQPHDFLTLGWNEISSVCDVSTGACNGTLGSIDVTGYTWASIDDVVNLFNFFLPGDPVTVPPYDEVFYFSYGTWFYQLTDAGFESLPIWYLPPPAQQISGLTRSVRSYYAPLDSAYIARASTYFTDDGEVVYSDDLARIYLIDISSISEGSAEGVWLFKATHDASLPATLSLVALGLTVLSYQRRNRAGQS